jgi:hypothetical protein
LWRANRRRLDLEQMRDSLLVAAGRLDETMGGPSVSLTDAPFSTRRAVYGYIERQNLPAFFRTFDFANPNTHTPERPLTTSPQQALFLMNSPYVMEQSIHLAARGADASGVAGSSGPASRVNRLYQLALGRDADAEEIAEALVFVDLAEPVTSVETMVQSVWQLSWVTLGDVSSKVRFHNRLVSPLSRWEQLAQVLLMSNEFMFVD